MSQCSVSASSLSIFLFVFYVTCTHHHINIRHPISLFVSPPTTTTIVPAISNRHHHHHHKKHMTRPAAPLPTSTTIYLRITSLLHRCTSVSSLSFSLSLPLRTLMPFRAIPHLIASSLSKYRETIWPFSLFFFVCFFFFSVTFCCLSLYSSVICIINLLLSLSLFSLVCSSLVMTRPTTPLSFVTGPKRRRVHTHVFASFWPPLAFIQCFKSQEFS